MSITGTVTFTTGFTLNQGENAKSIFKHAIYIMPTGNFSLVFSGGWFFFFHFGGWFYFP